MASQALLAACEGLQKGKHGCPSNVQGWQLVLQGGQALPATGLTSRRCGCFCAADSLPHCIPQWSSYITKDSREFTWHSPSCLKGVPSMGLYMAPSTPQSPLLVHHHPPLQGLKVRTSVCFPVCKTHICNSGKLTTNSLNSLWEEGLYSE